MAYIAFSPFASGLRGFSPGLGNVALLVADSALILSFAIAMLRPMNLSHAFVLFLIFYALVQYVASPIEIDPLTFYLGFRKTLFVLMALIVGVTLTGTEARSAYRVMLLSLVLICLYGIKQHFHVSQFDLALLDALAADQYTNMIDGKIRATSLLSSGFHLGMAGTVLMTLVLFRSGSRIGGIILISIAIFAIYASYTRTFLGLAIIILLFRTFLFGYLRSFLSLGLLGLFLLFTYMAGFDPFGWVFETLLGDQRFTERSLSYVQFSSFISDEPELGLFGFGLGSAGSTLGGHFPYGYWIEPHNIFLKYLFEFGPIMAVLIFVWVGVMTWKSTKTAVSAPLFHPAVPPVLLSILVISGLFITSVEAWPISEYVAILIGSISKIRDDTSMEYGCEMPDPDSDKCHSSRVSPLAPANIEFHHRPASKLWRSGL
ncbi:MAG: hypothetical protein P8X77_11945 [Maritimibacter sp.]